MQALFRVLMLVIVYNRTGLKRRGSVRAQQFSPPLLPGLHASMGPHPGSTRSAVRPQCQCRPVPLWAEVLLPA